jgi:hypothetical protein
MAPTKLKLHVTRNHSSMTNKDVDYFKCILEYRNKQSTAFVSKVTVSEKAQKVCYLVLEFIAQKRKSHRISKNLIRPACKFVVGKILGQPAV